MGSTPARFREGRGSAWKIWRRERDYSGHPWPPPRWGRMHRRSPKNASIMRFAIAPGDRVEPSSRVRMLSLQMIFSARLDRARYRKSGGERGIRTLEGLLTPTPLAGARLRPLGHLSGVGVR